MKSQRLVRILAGAVLMAAGAYMVWLWMFERVYVRPNELAVLIRKTGATLPAGQTIAEAGQKGIQRGTLGPGRYFLNPFVYEVERHPLLSISAGDPNKWLEVYKAGAPDYSTPSLEEGKWPEVGIVTSLAGKTWTGETEIVDAGYQGKQRQVLTPGHYRINPRAYRVEKVPAVVVPVGCCGVVTSQLGSMPGAEEVHHSSIGPDGKPLPARALMVQKLAEPGQRGILRDVLTPGIYYLNPYVHKVRIVQVGYNLISQMHGTVGEKIEFPSSDGFTVDVEVSVVWGRHPSHTPELINRLGDVDKISELIVAQIRSICRNIGSEYVSTDFIEGSKRAQYQRAVTETLQRVCRERNLEILIALIHNIEVHAGAAAKGDTVPADLKETIQRGFIAREQDLTRQKQRQTAVVRAELQTAEAGIGVAREEVTSDTRKKVAETQATATRRAAEIDAQRDLEVAQIERQIAELESETRRVMGTAEAEVARLKNESQAAAKRMMVEAFGSGNAYNLYTFARNFSPESIRLIFAGPGTFWTDLNRLQDAAAMQLLKQPGLPAGPPAK